MRLSTEIITTICGIKGRQVIDDSMKIVYGDLPTNRIEFCEPVSIIYNNEKIYAHSFDFNGVHEQSYINCRTKYRSSLMIELETFEELYKEQYKRR